MAAKSVSEHTQDVKATEEIVEVFLPKVPGETPSVWVGVNGEGWQFPRGKKTKVPKRVADVLERSQQAQDDADEYSDEEQKKMTVIQGAPV